MNGVPHERDFFVDQLRTGLRTISYLGAHDSLHLRAADYMMGSHVRCIHADGLGFKVDSKQAGTIEEPECKVRPKHLKTR